MPIPQDHGAEAAGTVRQALAGALPVFAEGRLATPEAAGAALKAGQADAVVMTRALASDPRLPLKLAGSDEEPIRPHVGAPRYFSVRGDWNRPMGDLANPRAGREALLPEPAPLENPRPALVIGGGPAGLEAAITLARQRRPVTLLERGPELGGLARSLAAEVPARREFQTLVDYYLRMVERLGVRVELNREVVDYEDWMETCEQIYVATGAKARTLGAAGEGEIPGVSARALLTGAAPAPLPAGGRALVVDGEYGFRMGAAVEWLLERGLAPEVVTDDFFVGRELVESAELPWFNRVAERGVLFHPRLVFQGVRGGEVVCVERFSGQERMLGRAAIIVHALPEEPADDLFPVLSARHPGVIRIGDARAPRLMGEAILNAHRSVVLGR
ncbi:MAG: FAD-dependent oxidoreductase [SAR324 cluster bacterium]|nr:FAD-dependent oxidoreductase [SAR324 cluster bacterium]